ncbi:hypothetical protein VP1G_10855 [Cytospora mali]|uniref:Uncharacterized protein n=1 Tax=Cytospora mali TaxID=578113 RepID=A0A194UZ63_CYTMA|nr:hypothetical protein VP1G_10855 [Valsa mali var. pyri (nom. inval.)]
MPYVGLLKIAQGLQLSEYDSVPAEAISDKSILEDNTENPHDLDVQLYLQAERAPSVCMCRCMLWVPASTRPSRFTHGEEATAIQVVNAHGHVQTISDSVETMLERFIGVG